MSATSALESNEDLEHVTLVRMEDVQPDRSSDLYYSNDHLVGTCVVDNLEYDNECVIDDEDSHIGSMVSIKSEEVDSDAAEYIVPDLMPTPGLLKSENIAKDTTRNVQSSWPTLEILPGGVIKDADKYEDIALCSDVNKPEQNSNEMVYACAKCSRKYKYLFCLVKHVKWHEEQAKKEKRPGYCLLREMLLPQKANNARRVRPLVCKGKVIRRIHLKSNFKNTEEINNSNLTKHKTNLS